MDSEDNASGFDWELADQLYQLLLDLHTKGSSDICVDPKTLLSTEADRMTAMNRSAALEKEAQDILRVFTNLPVTPIRRNVNVVLSNPNERALVPVNNLNIVKRRDNYKIDIWKENNLVTSIQNDRSKDVIMHFINIQIDKTGSFIITGLENVDDEIREVIRELGGLIAIEDVPNLTGDGDGLQIREITENSDPMIEIPLYDGILKFSPNQNPIDVLSEIFCMEETSDNKKIFKVPELGDFVVSPEDDPIEVFKAITGHDLRDFYKNLDPESSDMTVAVIPENNVMEIPENDVEIPENNVAKLPENDDKENKENVKKVKNKTNQRHKKNKQKRKSKKRN